MLPVGGHFYFSTDSSQPNPVLVDDQVVIRLNGIDIFSYDFSANGHPQAALVEVPRAIMAQVAGQTVIIEYRDLYSITVSASEVWLIWTP